MLEIIEKIVDFCFTYMTILIWFPISIILLIVVPILLSKYGKKKNKKTIRQIGNFFCGINLIIFIIISITYIISAVQYKSLTTKAEKDNIQIEYTFGPQEPHGLHYIIDNTDVIEMIKEYQVNKFKGNSKYGYRFTAKKQGTANILINVAEEYTIDLYNVTIDENLSVSYEKKTGLSLNWFLGNYYFNEPAPNQAYYVKAGTDIETELTDVEALQAYINLSFGSYEEVDTANTEKMNYIVLKYGQNNRKMTLYIDKDDTFYIKNLNSDNSTYYHFIPDEWMDMEYFINLQNN